MEMADYDSGTAKAMFQTERYLYVGFMAHQAIEKALAEIESDKGIAACTDGGLPVMDKKEALSLARRFGMFARSRLPVASVWLYGSYAYGLAREESDIDIKLEPVLIDPEHDRSGFSEMVTERGIQAYL
jgi:predicted nucleotidyltransferase